MDQTKELLILIVDSDRQFCMFLSDFFTLKGVKSAFAYNSSQAFEMAATLRPQVIIVDYCLPGMNGITFLGTIKSNHPDSTVIISSTCTDIQCAVQAIKSGAADFIVKPVVPSEILEKIYNLKSIVPVKEPILSYTEFATLNSIVYKIASIRDSDALLTTVLESSCSMTDASSGCLYLYDKESNELVNVRSIGFKAFEKRVELSTGNKPVSMAEIVFRKRKPVIFCGATREDAFYSADLKSTDQVWFEIGVPLTMSDDIIGLVWLLCCNDQRGFSHSTYNLLDVIITQAGVAFNNLNIFTSINKKLGELILVSNYSEQLMGLVDKYDIIKTLYTTTISHFPIDIIGFLIVQKRTHEFLYWTRGVTTTTFMKNVCSEVIDSFNKSMSMSVNQKRVRLRELPIELVSGTKHTSKVIDTPLRFKHIAPVCWEDFKFGAIFFGSNKDLHNKSEVISLVSSLVNQTRIALINSRLYSDIKENYLRTIKALAIAVDAKDTYTHGHSENVMHIAEEIARSMSLDEKTIDIIRDAGLLHDIGKIGIPGYILNKPGPLTNEEFNGIMKTHSALGANIVKDVPFLRDLYKLILYHHEHFDGSGYPDGIRGEQIPIGARILHVADAFEAMTSDRPYRTSLGEQEAIKRLIEGVSKQFDPEIINVFLKIPRNKNRVQ